MNNSQGYLFDTAYENQNMNDVIYTPETIAQDIISFFKPSGKVLDPCRGDGAFYKYLPEGADWCELKEGKDFFQYSQDVDWIISNPPYSIFAQFLDHSFKIARNIVYLIPINKPFNSYALIQRISLWGGIKHIYIIGSGAKLKFPIGFCIGAVYFQKGYHGEMKLSFRDKITSETKI